MRATFVKKYWENETHTIATFVFQPAGRYRYEPGQYAVLSVPHDRPDIRGTERTMTITSSPSEGFLSFTMRIFPSGGSTYKAALMALQQGDKVLIYDALGDLVLPLDMSIPLVFVAGGVGIASYVSMIKQLTEQRDTRDITLFYSTRKAEDIVLQEPFVRYADLCGLMQRQYVSGNSENLTVQDIVQATTPDSLLYLSGPESMVESLRTGLLSASVSSQQIIFDYFDGYTEL